MTKELPKGIVTIVFTDIQNSTELWVRFGDSFMPVLEAHNQILHDALKEHDGIEVKFEGDSYILAFTRPRDAVRFAVKFQLALNEYEWPEHIGKVLVRIGIHTGEPLVIGSEYFGPCINKAKRVQEAAHGGQILISAEAHALLKDTLPDKVSLLDLKFHYLKGLAKQEQLFQIAYPGIPDNFPPPRTLVHAKRKLPSAKAKKPYGTVILSIILLFAVYAGIALPKAMEHVDNARFLSIQVSSPPEQSLEELKKARRIFPFVFLLKEVREMHNEMASKVHIDKKKSAFRKELDGYLQQIGRDIQNGLIRHAGDLSEDFLLFLQKNEYDVKNIGETRDTYAGRVVGLFCSGIEENIRKGNTRSAGDLADRIFSVLENMPPVPGGDGGMKTYAAEITNVFVKNNSRDEILARLKDYLAKKPESIFAWKSVLQIPVFLQLKAVDPNYYNKKIANVLFVALKSRDPDIQAQAVSLLSGLEEKFEMPEINVQRLSPTVKGIYRLTREGNYSEPALSPGGSLMAAVNKREGAVILKLSRNPLALAAAGRAAKNAAGFAWSPDGKKLVYLAGAPDARPGLWVADVEKNGAVGGKRHISSRGSYAAWSPDSKSIAFYSEKGIYSINADGTARELLAQPGEIRQGLVWLPEGKIAFVLDSPGAGDNKNLCLLDIKTKIITTIYSGDIRFVQWYVSPRAGIPSKVHCKIGNSQFWMNWDGGKKKNDSLSDGEVCGPWSSDGNYFAYEGSAEKLGSALETYIGVFNTTQMSRERLTWLNNGSLESPAWLPGNRSIICLDAKWGNFYIILFAEPEEEYDYDYDEHDDIHLQDN
ncbi:hypothetical protein COY52_01775 [Candidatus Desantisbacteria bacterium CG_4_10_14_0_8_um_filter_48_22]|uniref:Guanylate cyclase domain-containing protein n=1 Tax=Candidatus Desantisbacteria bacterium CG_4_10_14_0_8_um_filter_48_22 TaxID=1974543 RepID=A0A2M7SEN8_9BACT|nr:MAG: hypothetical protein COS16_05750 [Candidatus Desantisbacteria bacterium CG02_land_8_20_14_3_00_49_13]PIZ17997.1 MAG: hypothetical protein COY52_01775 [Candidatus Desantisbacteria bacterium CG_4_10_14_0_8_um_filter_48_22]PJB27366.1 MAG: hypothetical protein CO111_05705 [Candidatus Desantisbacteria bacterium CG_4_9_14_3_um_filter_50_7]